MFFPKLKLILSRFETKMEKRKKSFEPFVFLSNFFFVQQKLFDGSDASQTDMRIKQFFIPFFIKYLNIFHIKDNRPPNI